MKLAQPHLSALVSMIPLVLLPACASTPRHIPNDAAVILTHADPYGHADPHVGTYVSKAWGFSTHSYWIEGPDGLVMIDTQFLTSAASEMVDWAEAATGKKVLLAIVLHPNPDKFNGTETLQRRGIRVVTSDEVRALIPAVFADRTKSFAARYGAEWPKAVPAPESFGSKTTTLNVAGLSLRLHVLGRATSEAHVVVEWEKHLFVGDLIASQGHPWLELGHVDDWLARLEELRALDPMYIDPGRGPSGGPELLDAEEHYLKHVKELVLAEHPTMPITDAGKASIEKIRATLVDEHPDYDTEVFLKIGLPAVWEELSKTSK